MISSKLLEMHPAQSQVCIGRVQVLHGTNHFMCPSFMQPEQLTNTLSSGNHQSYIHQEQMLLKIRQSPLSIRVWKTS